jgi:hypothetical protein
MDITTSVLATVIANRLDRIEADLSGQNAGGDFSGSVTASWVEVDSTGAGVVEYNGKTYKTKRLGFTSIPAGTTVELSYARGIYYSTW